MEALSKEELASLAPDAKAEWQDQFCAWIDGGCQDDSKRLDAYHAYLGRFLSNDKLTLKDISHDKSTEAGWRSVEDATIKKKACAFYQDCFLPAIKHSFNTVVARLGQRICMQLFSIKYFSKSLISIIWHPYTSIHLTCPRF